MTRDSAQGGRIERPCDGDDLLARGAWHEARAWFEFALAERETAEACEGLAAAARWLGDEEATVAARERAYVLYLERADVVDAARARPTWPGTA
jgi:hypothetical protein